MVPRVFSRLSEPMPLSRHLLPQQPLNALTVDVEDYFQVQALERVITRDSWDQREVRVEASTDRILAIFAEADCKATF